MKKKNTKYILKWVWAKNDVTAGDIAHIGIGSRRNESGRKGSVGQAQAWFG